MRIPITLSERAVRDAKAYMANPDPEHAVESLIDSYGNLVSDLRKLRARVRQLDDESAERGRPTNRRSMKGTNLLDLVRWSWTNLVPKGGFYRYEMVPL